MGSEVRIESTTERGIVVEVGDKLLDLSWRWLRDHARDPESFHRAAQQRLVRPEVVAASGPGTARVYAGELEVSWPAGPTTTFTSSFLASLGSPRDMYLGPDEAEPWRGDQLGDRLVDIPYDDITTPAGSDAAVEALAASGVVKVGDVPIDHRATRRVLEQFGYIRSTIFGDLWDFSSDGAATRSFDDTASTPLEITPHTDGTYSNDAPGLLGLHCHRYDATGGENVFVDGHALVAELSNDEIELLSTVDIPGQYIGDGAHLVARRPALRFEEGRLVQVSYNHHDRAPFLLPEPTMTQLYDALDRVDALANDPALQYELPLRPGQMVIFDNWRILHGRRAFSGTRLIAGGYTNHEDLQSTRRLRTA